MVRSTRTRREGPQVYPRDAKYIFPQPVKPEVILLDRRLSVWYIIKTVGGDVARTSNGVSKWHEHPKVTMLSPSQTEIVKLPI